MNTPLKTDYNKTLHRVYQQARQLPDETKQMWMNHLARYISKTPPFHLLDLGSGTGRFSKLIAGRFNCNVTGIEPSDKMREIAEQSIIDPNICFLPGDSGHIPAADGIFSYAWLSMVIHHIQNFDDCAGELSRVLSKNGLVFIRNSLKSSLNNICMYQYFPRALEIDSQRLPDVSYLVNVFDKHGFSLVAHDILDQTIDKCFDDHIERLRKRGVSTLELLTDEEFAQGIANMEKASRQMDQTQPVYEKIDFLVFRSNRQ